MKLRLIVTTCLLALVLLGVILWWPQTADRPLDKVGAVRIAAPLALPGGLISIAEAQGLFAKAGLDATIRQCDFGKACAEDMFKGEADLALAAEFKAAHLAFTQKTLRILGITAYVHTTKLLGLKEQGVAGPADLKGKRAGVIPGTISEYFLARMLTLNGLRREDITWVGLPPKRMAQALKAGEVDAVMVFSPFSRQIKAELGERLSESDGQPGQDYYLVLMGQQDWLARNPRIAERVMLALKWAQQWITDHPRETLDFLAAKYQVPPAELAEDLQNTRFSIGLPQALASALDEESRWLAQQPGQQGSPPANILDLIAFEPLSAAAPDSVTMLRGDAGR